MYFPEVVSSERDKKKRKKKSRGSRGCGIMYHQSATGSQKVRDLVVAWR